MAIRYLCEPSQPHSVLEKEDIPLMIVTTWHTNQNPSSERRGVALTVTFVELPGARHSLRKMEALLSGLSLLVLSRHTESVRPATRGLCD